MKACTGSSSSVMANSFPKTSCRFCSKKPTNSRQFLPAAASLQSIHRTSNIKHLTSQHEHRICWSWQNGLKHGAPSKGSAVPDYGDLRYKPRESDICCCRGWLRRKPGFVGSHGSIRCDFHGSDGRQGGASDLYRIW